MLSDLFRIQADLVGARIELAAGLLSKWLLNRVSPQGGGNRPVISIPGFLASDNTLLRLNRYLNDNGFDAQSWGMGRNLGPRESNWDEHLAELTAVVGADIRELADKHDNGVALIGQSLGGVYARELALQLPDYVDRVIMLGSPTFHPYLEAHHNRIVAMLGYWVSRRSHTELAGRSGLLHWESGHPAMPCISFHSPIDGVVDEKTSTIPAYIVDHCTPEAPRENVRVLSTHIGMGVNPWVLLALADRLSEDRNDWQTFDPYRYFPGYLHWAVRLLFPPADETADSDLTSLAESV